MNKLFSFMAGALCGALVGTVSALLLTPASGEELKAEAKHRWQLMQEDAKQAAAEKERELNFQFEAATTHKPTTG